jgi:hypothetical protein
MAVTETLRALGQWSVKLRPDTPRTVLDSLVYFGHLAVSAGRDNPRIAGDSLLASARYVGVLRGVKAAADGYELTGAGMAFWLGDEDKKGSVIENLVTLTSSTFTNAVRALLPSSGAVTEGTLYSVSGTYSGTHQYQSPREAIDYVCTTMGAAWRVNGNGTLDAGLESDLFVTTPQTLVTSRSSGVDMTLRALPGAASLAEDVDDFTTRVLLLAQGTEGSTATGSANILVGLNPYKDIHGNTVVLTRMVSESVTDQGNATARAQVQLNRFTDTRDAVTLDSTTHDIRGDLATGDYVWAFDPDAGLVDLNNEVNFYGERLNPVKLQVVAVTWPVEMGAGIAYRDSAGNWTDLSDYVVFESGSTSVTVGGYNRSLTNSTVEPVGSRPQQNTSVPDVPVFTPPFIQAVYQSPASGAAKAQIQLAWAQPDNTDGTGIIDGDHYELRYRPSSTPAYPSTWAQLAVKTWSQLSTWDQAITYASGPWQQSSVGFDFTDFLVQELTPGVPYEFQIRALDNGTPANASDWSASQVVQMGVDVLPPATPAPPTVAASRIALQITHTLGQAAGGTFNLDADLHHLEIHAQYEPTFAPDDTTLIGKLLANSGMITGQIPVVGTFQVESTDALYVRVVAVDESGNKSGASTAVQATAELIDDAHISDLTVSKVTAGTVTSDWVQAGDFSTGTTGARAGFDADGFYAFDAAGDQTVDVSSADGSVLIQGTLQSGSGTSNRIVVNPDPDDLPRIDLYSGDPYTRHVTLVEFAENFLLQREDNITRDPDGGWLQFSQGNSYFGHRAPAVSDSYMQFFDNGGVGLKGFFEVGTVYTDPMLFVGELGPVNGPTAVALSYGVTLLNSARVIPGLLDTSDSFVRVSLESTTGFTGNISAGTGVVFRFMAWR